jgi:hypothetical protein
VVLSVLISAAKILKAVENKPVSDSTLSKCNFIIEIVCRDLTLVTAVYDFNPERSESNMLPLK